jgi:hypothetical protein
LGYAYYKSYFGSFGVDVLSLPIPIDHYFAQGVLSFFMALVGLADTGVLRWIPLLCTIILILALVFPQFARIRTIVAWVVIVPLLASGIASAFTQGQEDAGSLTAAAPAFVDVRPLTDISAPPPDCAAAPGRAGTWSERRAAFIHANECGNLRGIWQDERGSVVGEQICVEAIGCRWQVYRLSAQDFALTTTESESVRTDQTVGEAP